MIAAVDWANLNTAAAFVLGAILGSLATLRVMRYVLAATRSPRRRPRDDDT